MLRMCRLSTFESRAKSLESIASGYVWIVWWIDSQGVRATVRFEAHKRARR